MTWQMQEWEIRCAEDLSLVALVRTSTSEPIDDAGREDVLRGWTLVANAGQKECPLCECVLDAGSMLLIPARGKLRDYPL